MPTGWLQANPSPRLHAFNSLRSIASIFGKIFPSWSSFSGVDLQPISYGLSFLILKNRSFAQFAGAPGINPMGAVELTPAKSLGAEAALLEPESRLTGPTLVKNYLLAALAGVIWYFQFFFYSMGQTKMGKYDFSSWTLHMASIIIFATLWGMALKEWKGTSRRTKALVALGLFLLVGSTVVVGYGNYLKVR